MKITIYTINDCQYSRAEKEYLQAHNLPYEEKNLESNKEYLTEMLAISNNFAGTPVTKVEKDDGQISVLKGFTKEEFDKLTGVGQPAVAVVNSTMNVPADKPATPPPAPTPTPTPPPQPIEPPKEEPAPPPVQTPPATPEPPKIDSAEAPTVKQNEALNSVLNNLQAKAEASQAAAPAANLPNVPEPDFK